ncbi:MAG TPA: M28 family peptidase [Gaiellaceae bacterium]|jgi:Peptidase family M28/PA domain
MQRRHALVAALCVVVGICVFGTAGAGAKTLANCDTQANDTPDTLLPCITKSDLQGYMTDLWNIAVANPGPDGHPSRNSGEPGYWESAQYVKNKMESWGYTVSLQQYDFPYTAFRSLPTFSVVSPAMSLTFNEDWTAAPSNGNVTGAIQPAGGIILPPTPTPTSSSGCTAADFTGFTPGKIALIQRGSCNFGVKVLNAQAAGAIGVVIFNEGNPGRTGLQGVNLVDANGATFAADIPVISVTFAVGEALYNAYQGGTPPVVSMSVSALADTRADWNVIADSKGGDKNHTLVIDAHLDAIYGAGMLDNGSGSMSILDIAYLMRNAKTTNHLRFIWFGGEELGLLGSDFYVHNLSSTDASHIGYDLDADVTATPNYTLGILDPSAADLFDPNTTTANTFPNRVYKASLVGRDAGIAYLDSQHQNHQLFSPEGTDAYEFNLIGVPASGVLTGQDCCKTQAQVDLFAPNYIGTVNQVGNFEGNLLPPDDFDGGCVDNSFRWCDNLDNNNFDVMTLMTRDFANMVLTMAYDTKVMSASGSAVINKKTALSQETGSRHIARS